MARKESPARTNIQKRPSGRWQARFRRAGHPAQSRTFDTKSLAQQWLAQMACKFDSGQLPPRRILETVLFAELLVRYRDEVAPHLKGEGATYARSEINQFLKHPISRYALANLKREHFAALRNELLRSPNGRGGTLATGTVVRKLTVLKSVIAIARNEWDLEAWASPMANLKMPKPSARRTRRFTPQDKRRLVRAWFVSRKQRSVRPDGTVVWKPRQASVGCRNRYVVYVIRLAMETSLRKSAILNLREHHIDWDRQVINLPPELHKNDRAVPIPVTGFALSLIRRALREKNRKAGDTRICPIEKTAFNSAWRRLKTRAGLQDADLHFHDTRAEAITSSLEVGLSLIDVKVMANIEDFRSLQHYARMSTEGVVDRLEIARNKLRQSPSVRRRGV